jgi:RNA polymerase sigma factor (sigma-70 family)
MQAYLQSLSALSLLTPEQETALARKMRAGDTKAREQFIQSNLRLVVSFAKAFQNRGVALMDLVLEGNVGLIKAADRFDPELGHRFSTYAKWWIQKEIRAFIDEQKRVIQLPENARALMNQYRGKRVQMEQAMGRPPALHEVAEALQLTASEQHQLQRALQTSYMPDAAETAEGGESIAESLSDPSIGNPLDKVVREDQISRLDEYMDKAGLDERERSILNKRYGRGKNQRPQSISDLAREMNLTRERIRQIENEALRKLNEVQAMINTRQITRDEMAKAAAARAASKSSRRSPAVKR